MGLLLLQSSCRMVLLQLSVLLMLASTHSHPHKRQADDMDHGDMNMAGEEECCDQKMVGEDRYFNIGYDHNGMTFDLNCLSPCIFEKEDQPGSKYCFAAGDMKVECEDDMDYTPTNRPRPTGEMTEGPDGETDGMTDDGMTEDPNGVTGGASNNNADYCAIDSEHTMCVHTGPSDECTGKTILRGMTEAGKVAILEKHNELRRRVAKGEESGQPAAADMRELVWDDELEAIAQRWADQCTFEHDSVRTMLDGTRVGQNLYQSFSSAETNQDGLDAAIDATVQNWYDEVGDFDSGNIDPFVSASGPATGHYTQVVWAETDKLGCANVYFNEASQPSFPYTNLVVCNYAVAGNLISGSMYSQGAACSSCPSSTTCVDSLCQAA